MRIIAALLFIWMWGTLPALAQARDGSVRQPLEVILIPADGGTEDGTRADFLPLFNALTKTSGLHFRVRVGQSYAAAIEAVCTGLADVAWLGPTSYREARDRGCAELLAVESTNGSATYFAGIFALKDSGISSAQDLRGRSVAFGPPQSASSFVFPIGILLDAGIDPRKDLSQVRIGDSHTSGLVALDNGLVDGAAASFVSFERAANSGAIDASRFRIVGRSAPIPNPPMVSAQALPPAVKSRLRAALGALHEQPGISADDIRGYGGKRVDRYDITITDDDFETAFRPVAGVDSAFTAALVRRAGTYR
ncbi:phosphonate ABC transporter substrate-binding protein [Hyphomonas sp. CACIAM 19H1]|uniref:phosphate/phosphite/phosphonate ABC transporter substrate-binding protein n=1 Tax=Hyphomonas sp. CACIAM 19H1 TaxID=1873716 RepID=UPI000DEDE7B3|nr:phosphate/phosphite/phosphonate ABC transporter substrate-binding protein [Hyphomonas sp. CACIAM 19H1]AXE64626.1 phosphonate ABC transporter substrate-binding protein [Hyphomonas sp. CACIAM 19H1]